MSSTFLVPENEHKPLSSESKVAVKKDNFVAPPLFKQQLFNIRIHAAVLEECGYGYKFWCPRSRGLIWISFEFYKGGKSMCYLQLLGGDIPSGRHEQHLVFYVHLGQY